MGERSTGSRSDLCNNFAMQHCCKFARGIIANSAPFQM